MFLVRNEVKWSWAAVKPTTDSKERKTMKIEITDHEVALQAEAREITEGVFQRPDGTVIILGLTDAITITGHQGARAE